jgi:hypothetical protein
MDAYVTAAVGLAGAYVGFVAGVLVFHRFVRRADDGGGGGENDLGFTPPPAPGGLSVQDFRLWEGELSDTVDRGPA